MTGRLLTAAALLCCLASPAFAAAPAATAPALTAPADSSAAAAVPAAPAATLVVPRMEAPRQDAPMAPAAGAPAAGAPDAGSSTGNLMQTIFALLIVLGLIAALAWFLKRYGPKAAGGSANLRMVGALNLGGRERIMVIEVGDQWIVVGASPGRVNALATMPKQHTAEQPSMVQPGLPMSGGFADWLKQTIDKRNAK